MLFQLVICPLDTAAATSAVFCAGRLGHPDDGLSVNDQIDVFRSSGVDTLILFTMTVRTNGDFYYNTKDGDMLVCENGVYVAPSNWGGLLDQCREEPSSVERYLINRKERFT